MYRLFPLRIVLLHSLSAYDVSQAPEAAVLGGFLTGAPEMPPRKAFLLPPFTEEEPETCFQGKHLPRCSAASKACVQFKTEITLTSCLTVPPLSYSST